MGRRDIIKKGMQPNMIVKEFGGRMALTKSVIGAAATFTATAIQTPMLGSVVSRCLFNPDLYEFSVFGEQTYYRSVTPGNAVNYTGTWKGTAESTGSVKWVPVKATKDRAIVSDPIDMVDELNSILAGMTPSGRLLSNASLKKLGAEMDAVTIAGLNAASKSKFVAGTAGFELTADKIFSTLDNINKVQLDNGIYASEMRYTFMDTDTYNVLRGAIYKNGNGLFNMNVLTKSDFEFSAVPSSVDTHNKLKVATSLELYNNNVIVPVPKSLMNALVILYDGSSVGQKAGGWAPDITSSGAAEINIISVPVSAAVFSSRYKTSQLIAPLAAQALGLVGNSSANMAGITEDINDLFGNIAMFENIGVNPNGDFFQYNTRILYDIIAFDQYEKSIVVVGATPKI